MHKVQQEKCSGRRALAIIKNELLISEAGNYSSILVYNTELKHMRQIQCRDIRIVMDISADVHGNLYTTDVNIQVFRSMATSYDPLAVTITN